VYAIVEEGGKQFKVAEGDVIRIEKVTHAPGETFPLGKVLLLSKGKKVLVGQPVLDNVTVSAEVRKHGRGDKVVVRKFRRRKDSTTKQGHRQDYTEVAVQKIEVK